MANYEYIDAYFSQELTGAEVERFKQMLAEDKDFAEEVAFYVSAKQVLKEQLSKEKKERFKHLLKEEHELTINQEHGRIRKMWIYRTVAVAAIIIFIFSSWYLFYSKPLPVKKRAENYIQQNLTTLPVTMSTTMDSLQQGLKLYNEEQLNASLKMFESILQSDAGNYSAKKYLGIVYLRLANYDKALQYFQQLEKYPLYSNPAVFYQALTLMERNRPGDKPNAKQLLQKVIEQDMEGKQVAKEWLNKW